MKTLGQILLVGIFWTTFVLIFSGCATQQRCAQLYPPQVRDSVRVKDSVVVRQVAITIPKDSIVWHDSIPCLDFTFDYTEKKNNITASVHISKGKMTFKCAEDSLRAVIQNLEHFKETVDCSVKVETKIEYVKHWWNPYADWFALFVLIGIGVWLAVKLSKA